MAKLEIDGFKELLKVRGNLEWIAYKMGRESQTVERWANGLTRPAPAEEEKLRRIVKRMRRRQLAA